MNCFVKTFFTFIIITFTVFSQEITDSTNINHQPIRIDKNFSSVLDDLDFYLDLQNLNKTFMLNADPNTKWLWTSYAISNSSQEAFDSELNLDNMTQPLHQKYLEDSKFNPFRYALGMMQVGAVGYLAYKHIKKYGLLKK
jgi:hypothetical protein